MACSLRTGPSGDAFATVTESPDGEVVGSSEFRIGGRWGTTSSGSSGSRGTPTSLTWGVVADGTTITGSEGSSPSDLVSTFNGLYGGGRRGGVENSGWFPLFESAFERWEELSGLTFDFEPNDGGAAINNTTAPSGQAGVYADIRIGGHSIDGASGSNTLAYNYFPSHGDMVIDTDNSSFYNNRSGGSLRLRNTLMHEIGHGIGLSHLESSNSGQLMEPFISTAFDGPQIDDILAVQRNYGDALEKGGGNDTYRFADAINATVAGDAWSIGTDGGAVVVQPGMVDFVSIDGSSDNDYFRLTVDEPTLLTVELSQLGRSYSEGPQDGTQTTLDASRLNSLRMSLWATQRRGIAVAAEADPADRNGLRRAINEFELTPGLDYYVQVYGTSDNVQLYRLDLSLAAVPVPEPLAWAMAAIGLVGARLDGRGRRA